VVWENGTADLSDCLEFPMSDIWGASPTDVFAVGYKSGREGAGICHFDGEAWHEMSAPAEVYKIWGVSGSDVYAVGGDTVLHYDGESWSVAASFGPGVRLAGVWAASHDDVFVVGDDGDESAPLGLVFHYDGVAWSEMDVDLARSLRDVRGTAEGKVLAVGTGGEMLRYDGSTWEPILSGTSDNLNAVWISSDAAEAYVVGDSGTILHRCSADW